MDAEETTQSVVEDAESLPRLLPDAAGSSVLLPALQERGVKVWSHPGLHRYKAHAYTNAGKEVNAPPHGYDRPLFQDTPTSQKSV